MAALDPSTALLDQLKSKRSRICPLICRSGFENNNDKCVPVKREASIQKKEPLEKTTTKNKTIENTKNKASIKKRTVTNERQQSKDKMYSCISRTYHTRRIIDYTERWKWANDHKDCKEL